MPSMTPCKCSLVAALVSLLVVAASAQQLFHSGSRYGKRGETSMGSEHEDRRGVAAVQRFNRQSFNDLQLVAPRTDRFYTGSRYGKRAERADVKPDDRMSNVLATSDDDDQRVTCLYTGVKNLYRCFDRKENSSEDAVAPQSN